MLLVSDVFDQQLTVHVKGRAEGIPALGRRLKSLVKPTNICWDLLWLDLGCALNPKV